LENYGVVAVVVVRWSKERKIRLKLVPAGRGGFFLYFSADWLWKLPDLSIIAA
jgi:hypothetical protein